MVTMRPFHQGTALGVALLTPTRIYVKSCLAALQTGGVRAFAHITGGGLTENLPRVLPDDLCATLDPASWTAPAVFDWLAKQGGIEAAEMRRTFNCGIGMTVIVAPDSARRHPRRIGRSQAKRSSRSDESPAAMPAPQSPTQRIRQPDASGRHSYFRPGAAICRR